MSNSLIQGDSNTISYQAQRDSFLFCKRLVPDFKANYQAFRKVAPTQGQRPCRSMLSLGFHLQGRVCGSEAGGRGSGRPGGTSTRLTNSMPLKHCVPLAKSLALSVPQFLHHRLLPSPGRSLSFLSLASSNTPVSPESPHTPQMPDHLPGLKTRSPCRLQLVSPKAVLQLSPLWKDGRLSGPPHAPCGLVFIRASSIPWVLLTALFHRWGD
jgi:hypothetical protein